MIYRVKIENRTFEVEIKDIHARPVIAIVDGTPVEVWPEDGNPGKVPQRGDADGMRSSQGNELKQTRATEQQTGKMPGNNGGNVASGKHLLAPIPGVVLSIHVHPGEEVRTGQDVCVIEAMKMKNTIRSNRDGIIDAVRIAAGQTVKHRDVLVEFAE